MRLLRSHARRTRLGAWLLDIRVPLENFARAVTGLGHLSCEYDLNERCPIGKIKEIKYEKIQAPAYARPEDREIVTRYLLSPFEVDGWKGTGDDLYNSHKRKDGMATVAFYRYVDPLTGEMPAPPTPES